MQETVQCPRSRYVSLSTDNLVLSRKAYYHASDGNHVDVATTQVTFDLMHSPYRHVLDV
jgi:hypothetical protein